MACGEWDTAAAAARRALKRASGGGAELPGVGARGSRPVPVGVQQVRPNRAPNFKGSQILRQQLIRPIRIRQSAHDSLLLVLDLPFLWPQRTSRLRSRSSHIVAIMAGRRRLRSAGRRVIA